MNKRFGEKVYNILGYYISFLRENDFDINFYFPADFDSTGFDVWFSVCLCKGTPKEYRRRTGIETSVRIFFLLRAFT